MLRNLNKLLVFLAQIHRPSHARSRLNSDKSTSTSKTSYSKFAALAAALFKIKQFFVAADIAVVVEEAGGTVYR